MMKQPCPHCDQPDLSLLRLVLIGELLCADETLLLRLADVMQQCEQHLDSLRQKDSLRGLEATEISVYLGNYSASHFEGSACGLLQHADEAPAPESALIRTRKATVHYLQQQPGTNGR